ncbi:MAG: sodium/proline symporter [Candidatus Marinimicrobia bacterium]|jgi:sodium/proline symporter|nr:sodium/proline symporter [Candidatus Neomarinimicrobiota bacterium]|tara:strand:+ start:820 stop:2286 length:1467 start_codon:yes stop_codon:yes gene_type:complete
MDAVAVGFVVYLVIILIVGLYTSRLTKTLPDYLLAGRRLGPWVVAFSERASGESAWMLLGLTGLAYATGFGDPSGTKLEPALWTAIGGVAGIAASWFLVAEKLRRQTEELGALTLPRFFELKFRKNDPLLRFVATGIITFCFAFYIAAQFDAAGKALSQTFGWPEMGGVLVGAAIIVFYTFMGGFLAVAWTDFVQGWIMLITLVVLPLVTLSVLGGWEGMTETIAKETSVSESALLLNPTGGRTGWTLLAGILGGFGVGFGYAGQPHLLARYMSIRSVGDITKSRSIAISWAVLAYGGAVLMGIVALAYFGPNYFTDPELMMPELAKRMFPSWFAGILICGALAAMMSTADSQLLVTTSAISEDVYHQSINPKAEQVDLVKLSRIATLIIGVVAIFLSQLPNSIFDKVLFAWGALGAAFGPALILALWWERTTRNGVLAGMIVGFLTIIIWDNFIDIEIYSLVPGFIFAMLAIILFSILSNNKKADVK